MPHNRRESFIYMFFLCILFVVWYVFLNQQSAHPEETKIANSTNYFTILYDEWSERIDKKGKEESYEEFKKEYNDKSYELQHNAAHIIGELLYEKEGLSGLAVCDETFAFGCYHGFFLSSLSQEGISIITELNNVCADNFDGFLNACQHGIGHGVLEFAGHKNLKKALEMCEMTLQEEGNFGCSGGVFMEFNFPGNVFSEELRAREYEAHNPYYPCDSENVPEKFKNSCYHSLPQWWKNMGQVPYTDMGNLCVNVYKEEYRNKCFLGVGNIAAPSTGYNIEDTIKICLQMPSLQSIVMCRTGASNSFAAEPNMRKYAKEVCGTDFKEDRCMI